MPEHVIDVSSAQFDRQVLEASRELPVLVDFWAPWCAPCRSLGPLLERLAREYGGRFVLAKVNSDDNPDIAAAFGVRGIPNVKAFVDGRLVDEFTGALPEAAVRQFIDALVPSLAEPIRLEARAARERGETDATRRLLLQAIKLDPRHEAAQLDLIELLIDIHDEAEAERLLEEIEPRARDGQRCEVLRARLALGKTAAGTQDEHGLRATIAGDPGNLEARLALSNQMALARRYREAMDELVEIVKRDRSFRDDAGRSGLVTLFNLLGSDHDLVREYRHRLAALINR